MCGVVRDEAVSSGNYRVFKVTKPWADLVDYRVFTVDYPASNVDYKVSKVNYWVSKLDCRVSKIDCLVNEGRCLVMPLRGLGFEVEC